MEYTNTPIYNKAEKEHIITVNQSRSDNQDSF
jgi:hypothetical protein